LVFFRENEIVLEKGTHLNAIVNTEKRNHDGHQISVSAILRCGKIAIAVEERKKM
jgi:hypothetical protein